ncbi:plasmid mobilization relaxosome protein MobC [Neorhizobium sp. T25_27]|uniref:plasmid mobilization protein n=1 Tax=Neorhizobium sp. T25_27 TaxID=2093831 RepID=UPI000CF9E87C|nr:plasmid mobilization relaxosome protein MobC [Neorhizobium sp. T25_27]
MRDRIIRIRASTEEISKIEQLAKGRGLSISEMMRRAALGVRMPVRTFDSTQVVLLTRALGELGRIGGNLNQLVRRANSGKLSGYDADLAQTLSGIDTLRHHLRGIIS